MRPHAGARKFHRDGADQPSSNDWRRVDRRAALVALERRRRLTCRPIGTSCSEWGIGRAIGMILTFVSMGGFGLRTLFAMLSPG